MTAPRTHYWYFRPSDIGDWLLCDESSVPDDIKPVLKTGRELKNGKHYWRALPRLPSSAEILAAAYRLSQEIGKARLNGDWLHPATQLAIELAHDSFRAMIEPDLAPLPPIVADPTSRRRWNPLRGNPL